MLLLFLTFSVLVANPRKIMNTAANPACGLLNREERTKKESLAAHHNPSHCLLGENNINVT